MSVISRTAFDSSKFKQKIKSFPNNVPSSKGPIKASYEPPSRQWQMKYQYNSPSKTVKNGGVKSQKSLSGKNADESSEYGTMENADNGVPLLNINDDTSSFNDITIEERKERIGAILDEILSIPRLAEANITQRSLSRSSMTRFTGGGSVRSGSSQMSSKMKTHSRQSNQLCTSSQQQSRLLRRSISSPKLNGNNQLEQPKHASTLNRKVVTKSTANVRKAGSIPKLNLALDVSSQSEYGASQRHNPREDDELSAEFLPPHNVSEFRTVLGNETQNELVLSVPTVGDDTEVVNDESDTFEMVEKSTDFVKANMRISPKKLLPSGRNSAASSIISAKHRAGSVPKYLKARQAEWAEAAAQALASIPDPDCPPGHVRLPEESRCNIVKQYNTKHATLLHELNRLPVSSDTRRVVTRRKELETQLGVLEEEIRNFSRPKVFLPPDVIEEILSSNVVSQMRET